MGGECSQKLGPGEECESSPGHNNFGQRKSLYLSELVIFPAAAARCVGMSGLILFVTSCFFYRCENLDSGRTYSSGK